MDPTRKKARQKEEKSRWLRYAGKSTSPECAAIGSDEAQGKRERNHEREGEREREREREREVERQ